MRLDNNDTEKSLQLVPETYGMDVPNSCTIVILAGRLGRPLKKKTKSLTNVTLRTREVWSRSMSQKKP